MIQSQQFRAVQRPKDLCSPYELVVVDGSGVPHLPLTVFYHETQRFLAEGTAKESSKNKGRKLMRNVIDCEA